MQRSLIHRVGGFAAALGVVAFVLAVRSANAQDITVVVNGEQVPFNQPPIEQADRVFVPLRGVFQRLGAYVDYSGGTIEANRGAITVAVHIGSTTGYVNGYPVQLDVAPFIIGRRTVVKCMDISSCFYAAGFTAV